MKAALINAEKIVANVIVWDQTCQAPAGFTAIPLDDAVVVSPGWKWINGTTFEDPTPKPPPTETDYANAIQFHIDRTAQSKEYADGFALASYVNSTVPAWAAEATTFVAWRDAVWLFAYAELAKVQSGARPQPTIEELISELPQIVWPS